MNYPFFIFILIALCGYSLWIGKKASTASANNVDYFLSGRSLKVFGLTLTLLATQLGGGAIIGNGESAFQHGWKAIFYSLGLSCGLLVLALGLGSRFRKLNVNTIPELFQKKYNSPVLHTVSALFSIISLFLILIAIGIAARKIFISIGLESNLLFIFFWLISIIYTVIGGLHAIVQTAILQMIFIVFALLVVCAFIVFTHPAPLLGFASISEMPTYNKSFIIPWSEWILMPLLFVIIGQDMGQRCFAADSSKTIAFASFWAAVFLLALSAIPTFIGTLAASTQFVSPNTGSTIMNFIQFNTNPYVTALFAAAILMAIVSTADSLLCSISLNVSQDIVPKVFPTHLNDIKTSKIITLVIGISAILCSFLFENIIPLMVFAYKVSIYALFVPIFMSTIFHNPNKYLAHISIIFGICLFMINQFFINKMWFDLFSIGIMALVFVTIQMAYILNKWPGRRDSNTRPSD